ncbi:Plasmodium vivax Vir protein, putative [Plasmodium vivax]|nr:Plasmodium vivax Vir protein, putative [Plasmodium vivax]
MADSNQDYDSFQQYSNNHDVYERIKSNIGDEFGSFPEEVLQGRTENKDSITKDCLRLSKYLRNFHDNQGCKNKNCCPYINYVLNKMVHMYYDSNKSIFDIYNNYMNHENNSMIKNLCLTEINYMNQEKYNKIHELYNAYKSCKYYISNKDKLTSCNRAKFCANAYNKIMTKYTKGNGTKFCKNLKDLKDYLEQNEPISSGDCNYRFLALLSYPSECNGLLNKAENQNAPIDHTNGRLVVQEDLQKGVTVAVPLEQKEGTLGVRSPRVDSLGVDVPGIDEPGEDAHGVGVPGDGRAMEASDTLKHTPSEAEVINAKTPNDNTPIPVGTITYTSLGLVLPLVTLYRFTPLGSWVNTKLLGRNKILKNIKKNNEYLLLNSTENPDIHLDDAMYRIKYNSATKY